MNELIEWLKRNKICHNVVDKDLIQIEGLGLAFFQNMEKVKSLFKYNIDKEVVFNCIEDPIGLVEDEIFYVIFKFGDNWYYTDLRSDFKLNILKYVGTRTAPVRQEQLVNLGCHTGYELLNGSFLTKDWVKKAKYLGHKAIGVCDKNTMASHFAFQKDCEEAGIKPIFGYSLDIKHEDEIVNAKVYVLNNKGLRNLLRIQKSIMVDSDDHTISIEELAKKGNGNVLVFDKRSSFWLSKNMDIVRYLKEHFTDVFYQVDLSEYKAERIDIQILNATKHYFDNLYEDIAPILLTDAYYLDQEDYSNKIILNKVDIGAAHEQSSEQYFKDVDEHFEVFASLFDKNNWDIDKVFTECCENTMWIADTADARYETGRNFMPKYDMTEEEKQKYGTTHNMFNCLLEEGLNKLIPENKREVYRKQMEYEKYIIEATDNVDYLLVQYDTCNYARKNNILVGCGRGSAAGSLLLYLLGITLVDPLRFDLIFERFLLPERAGLYSSDVTIIGDDISSQEYVKIELENEKTIEIDRDAQLLVKRGESEEPIIVYADELQPDDDILFDNRDVLFTLNEVSYDTHR